MPWATVSITNETGSTAWILLSHQNQTNGTQTGYWTAQPGATVGPLEVNFETGPSSWDVEDYWTVLVHVPGVTGTAGFYQSPALECQLQSADERQSMTFTVSTSQFQVKLVSGGSPVGPMTRLAPGSPITNIFVVMLENHSFDNMFAMSGIAGITAATTSNSNVYDGTTYNVHTKAPLAMPTDPGHEFEDVLTQLAGVGASYRSGHPYPTIDNSGFAASYATSTTEGPAPQGADIPDIMACFDTPNDLRALYQLATAYAVCDHWFSSLPGPTWPNRFFVHGASSSGLDGSPSETQMSKWESVDGFQYPNGSFYDLLASYDIPYRFYNDSDSEAYSLYSDDPQNGGRTGSIPQVSSLHNVRASDVRSLTQFAADLQGPYPYPYTFIEPHYGDVASGTYTGGSSQHPRDDVYGGEHLLAAVYAAIRQSPYWNTSLLIVLYDEHGGFYDSVSPPAAVAPDDNPTYGLSQYGFTFEQYGVRVPAVIVSPLIPAGTVDSAVYDHSSVLATAERLFDVRWLTERDRAANDFRHLLSLETPRTDCPWALDTAALRPAGTRRRLTPEQRAEIDARPLPGKGNLIGTLFAAMKAEIELSGRTPPEIAAVRAKVAAIRTRGEARAYIESVAVKVQLARAQREAAAAARR